MSRVMFTLSVVWPEYSIDFDSEGKMIRDENGESITEEELSLDDTLGTMEEIPAILFYGEFDNEENIQPKLEELAKRYQVHANRIDVFYLDSNRIQP